MAIAAMANVTHIERREMLGETSEDATLFIYLSICLSVYLSIYLSIYLFLNQS
jgi:hypothetical protein